MNVEQLLKEYKKKKSKVDMRLATIEAWEKAKQNPETIIAIVNSDERILGMPRAQFKINNPVEQEVCKPEQDQQTEEEIIEKINKFIEYENSKIHWLKLEIDMIDIALKALTMQERFIIECKYFENMTWREIEINYNERYIYAAERTLQEKNQKIINKLKDILEPFYSKTA